MHFLIQTKSWSSAWNRLSTVSKLNQVISQRVLSSIYSGNESCEIDKNECLLEKFHELLEFGYLASQQDPFDPLEKEIKKSTEKFLPDHEDIHREWKLIREYPLSKNLLALSNVWESNDHRKHVVATKGAPEAIFELCDLNEAEKEKMLSQVQKMACLLYT